MSSHTSLPATLARRAHKPLDVEDLVNFGDPALPERFWDKVTPIPFPSAGMVDGCWLWTGSTTGRGYGSFFLGKTRTGRQRTGVAHKMTYEQACARLPKFVKGKRVRWVLDHRCRVRCCTNPNHLEAVAEPINVRRGESPAARNARKTHCPRGHEYTAANTYTLRVRKKGHDTRKRYCRACRRPQEEPCPT